MCMYTFWKGSIEGLQEDVELIADSYQEAVKAVRKHIARQLLKLGAELEEVIKVTVSCDDCGHIYEGWEHLDCSGHKEWNRDQLVAHALTHDNKYRKFKRLHRHHSMQEGGWIKADGSKVEYTKEE